MDLNKLHAGHVLFNKNKYRKVIRKVIKRHNCITCGVLLFRELCIRHECSSRILHYQCFECYKRFLNDT